MGRELQGKVNSGSHTWHLQNQRGEGGGLHRVYGYIRINLLVPKQECSTRSRVLGQSNIRVVHILRVEEETILTLNILHKGRRHYRKAGKFGTNSQRGGGLKKTDENSQFQFGNLKNLGEGGLNFSKMSEFQLFCIYFAILPL